MMGDWLKTRAIIPALFFSAPEVFFKLREFCFQKIRANFPFLGQPFELTILQDQSGFVLEKLLGARKKSSGADGATSDGQTEICRKSSRRLESKKSEGRQNKPKQFRWAEALLHVPPKLPVITGHLPALCRIPALPRSADRLPRVWVFLLIFE